MQKTALSVQSLACHGKCSLTEALPIVSSKGISLSVLPTVLLSTHTGGFGTPERLDVTQFFINTIEHFKKEKIRFDGIYTGYFSSEKQITDFCGEIDNLKGENSLVLVDPVLGDKGKLFSGITHDFVEEMLELCKKADVITPNITEAFLLCSEKYCGTITDSVIIDLAVRLYNITKARVVITGVSKGKKIGALIFDGENCNLVFSKKQPKDFHGTGDMFASLIFSFLLKGISLKDAVEKATKFISKAIENTSCDERDGLNFEKQL